MEGILEYIIEQYDGKYVFENIINFQKEGINYQLKYSGEKIDYLIKENENQQLNFNMTTNWSDKNEYLGYQTNSLINSTFDYKLDTFIEVIS